MKALVCILLLLETFVFVVQQQVDGGLNENEISQQISSEDGRQNPPQTDTLRAEASTDRQQYCDLGIPDIHAALRELTATVTEQKEKNRELTATVTEQKENIRELTATITEQKENIRELTTTVTEQKGHIRELTATVTEQKEINRALEMQQTFILEELKKKNEDREIAFSASLMESGSGFIGPFTTHFTLTYRNVFTNIGNAYNPITGIFTAPLKGAYMFRVSVFGIGPTAASAAIFKNGEHVVITHDNQPKNDLNTSNGVVLILEVGDVVYMRESWNGMELENVGDNGALTHRRGTHWEIGIHRRQVDDVLSPNINILEELGEIKSMETKMKSLETEMERLRTENKDREIAFSASLVESGSGYIGPFTTHFPITYKNVFTNTGNAYNPITGIFTAPLKGAYMFRISVYGVGGTAVSVSIIKNGEIVVSAYDYQPQNVLNSSNGVVLILEAGDVVYVRLGSGRRIYDNKSNHSTFSGFLLFPLR
ncbi:Complement C1q-like protein 2 [Anabarilius grahami]|uniref:Complement C1q-like protein 2 n=1 Tax=Anabarilius grahami TaxID=495550 RepID=A0A3N0XPG3_ANAGA|nr:Complement C1q-like protein 2 [Anabarilius grahami]